MTRVLDNTLIAATAVTLAVTLAACGSDESDSPRGTREGNDDKDKKAAPAREAKVLDTGNDKGKFPSTLAHADIEKPAAIKLRITPTPAAKTAISWTLACRRDRSSRTTDGNFTVKKKATKRLKVPLKRSDICVASASAQMSKGGKLKVQILG